MIAYALLFAAYLRLLARCGIEASTMANEFMTFADERATGYWAGAACSARRR